MTDPTAARVPWAQAAGCALVLGAAAALPFRAAPSLFAYPIHDDGYYALTVARHLGLGNGMTIDGIHLTGGVQPLWVLLLSPLSLLTGGDRTAMVRLGLGLSVLLFAAAAAFAGVFAARLAPSAGLPPRWTGWTAAALYVSCGAAFESHFNMLETGLLLVLYPAVLLFASRADWRRPRTIAIAGLLCGVLVVARVDAVFFAMLFVPIAVRPSDTGGWKPWLFACAAVPALAAIVSAPWFAYNAIAFGHLMPSGGVAQAADRFSPGRVLVSALYFAGRLVPFSSDVMWPVHHERWAPAVLFAAAVTVLATPAARTRAWAVAQSTEGRAIALLLVHGAVLALWYGVTSRAWWMYSRYAAPLLLAGVPVAALTLTALTRAQPAPAAMVTVLTVAGLAGAAFLPSRSLNRDRALVYFVSAADEVVPPGATLGAFQSGTLGFFRERVVNLDGKVNEAALRRQGDVIGYCRDAGIDWVADWPSVLDRDFFRGRPPSPEWMVVAERRLEGCPSCEFVFLRRR